MPMQHHMSRHREKIIDPFLPRGVEILVPPPPEACSALDKFLVYASSLIVVGSPLWFYGGIIYLYRKWKYYRSLATQAINNDSNNEGCVANEDDDFTSSGESSQESNEKQRTPLHQIDYHRTQQYERYKNIARKYGIALAAIILISLWGPHRSKRVGNLLNVRRWRLWDAWLNYVGFTVLHDKGDGHNAGRKLEKTLPRNSHQEFNIQTSPAIFAFVPHGIFP